MTTIKRLFFGVMGLVLLGTACTTLDKTSTPIDHPLMVGAYVAPNVKASEIPLALEKYLDDYNSETTSVSGNYQVSTMSSSDGIVPAWQVCDENDAIMIIDWIYLSQDFFGLAYNDQYRRVYAYFRAN